MLPHLSLSVTLRESSLTAEDHETKMRATPVHHLCHTCITDITCVSHLCVSQSCERTMMTYLLTLLTDSDL